MQLSLLSVLALATTALAAVAPHVSSDKRDLTERRLDTRATVKCTVNTQFLQNGKCVACTTLDKDASKCSTAGKITACKTKMFYSGKCYAAASCPSGTYANTSKKVCSTCTSLFTGSSKCTATAATACASSYFLSSGKCVKTCSTGQYGSAGKCSTCVSKFTGSATCSATASLTCASTYFLSAGKCLKTCPTGYYGLSGKCSTCSSKFTNSLTCSVSAALTCAKTFEVKSGKCVKTVAVATCTSSQYLSAAGACVDCSVTYPGSVACNATVALTCDDDHLLTDGKCPALVATPPCAIGEYQKSGVCTKCNDSWVGSKTCATGGAVSCKIGYIFHKNEFGRDYCLKDCGSASKWSGNDHNTCQSCTTYGVQDGIESGGALTCNYEGIPLTCSSQFEKIGLSCIRKDRQCNPGKYYNTKNNYCAYCTTYFNQGALTCSAEKGALTCDSGKVLKTKADGLQYCYTSCASGTYPQDYGSTCYPCTDRDQHAATCDFLGVPTTCQSNYKLGIDPNPSFDGRTICTVDVEPACADGEFFSEDTNSCVTCAKEYRSSGIATCRRRFSGGALTCKDGYSLISMYYGGMCAKNCDSDTVYGDIYSDSCQPCTEHDPNAITCSPGEGDPLTCQEGYKVVTENGYTYCSSS